MSLCGKDHQKLLHRLNRIEGQVRGLRRMLEEDKECLDVLKQVAAAHGAMRSLGMVILEDHLKGCVSNALRTGQSRTDNEDMIDQVISLFNKFIR